MSKNWPCWFYEITRQRMVRRAKNMMNHHVKTPLEKKIADDYLDYLYTYMLYHLDKEELADMLEVIYAATVARGYSIEELEAVRKKKAEARGGFEKRIFLKSVE